MGSQIARHEYCRFVCKSEKGEPIGKEKYVWGCVSLWKHRNTGLSQADQLFTDLIILTTSLRELIKSLTTAVRHYNNTAVANVNSFPARCNTDFLHNCI